MNRTALILGAAAALIAAPAFAHTGVGAVHGMAAGFMHPFLGADHLLAMVGVGVWAAQINPRRCWLLPLAFVAVMIMGAVAGFAGVAVPQVELGILGSVLLLGVLIAAAPRLPAWLPVLLVAAFAFFHGHAHGTELPAEASSTSYALGLVAATALLHAAGIGLAFALRRGAGGLAIRLAGLVIALAGGALAAGL